MSIGLSHYDLRFLDPHGQKHGTTRPALEPLWVKAPKISRSYQTTRTFEKGLQALQTWDRKVHPKAPVFSKLDIPALVTKAKIYIELLKNFPQAPYMINFGGPSAAGKSTMADYMVETALPNAAALIPNPPHAAQDQPLVTPLRMDKYYHSLPPNTVVDRAFFLADPTTSVSAADFENPAAMDTELLRDRLDTLRRGLPAPGSDFDFATQTRHDTEEIQPGRFLVMDGHVSMAEPTRPEIPKSPGLVFLPQPLRAFFQMNIYVHASQNVWIQRWKKRAGSRNGHLFNDLPEAKRPRAKAKFDKQFLHKVLDGFKAYILPHKDKADVVINNNRPLAEVQEAMDKLAQVVAQTFLPLQQAAQDEAQQAFQTRSRLLIA